MTKTLTPQRSAWDVPERSIAQSMQRDLQGQHAPAKASYFHIPKAADVNRTQRISRAVI